MTGAPIGFPLPPRREFLLSHHLRERYDRTLVVPGTRGKVRICSRCTGQLLGTVTYAAVLLTGAIELGGLLEPRVQVLWAFAPLPAAVDWVRQTVRGRESTNLRRVLSGALLGAALLDAVVLLLTRRWVELAVAAGVFLAYAGGIAAVLFSSGAWRRVLAEHLPGIDLPPGRDAPLP
jgi:uncharacterized membrane protein